MTIPIRVLVVDDNLMTRHGLAALLMMYKDVQLVGEARNGAEALELCSKTQPNVILMDLVMPKLDGAEATRAVRKRYPEIQVIVLISFDEYSLVQRALTAGAEGILWKNMDSDDLVANIRRVHGGLQQQAPKPIEEILRSARLPAQTRLNKVGADLTDREIEVLALMAQGLTNRQIGKELIISRATVKFHVSSILRKMGVATRTEAVALAVEVHLIDGPGNGLGYHPQDW